MWDQQHNKVAIVKIFRKSNHVFEPFMVSIFSTIPSRCRFTYYFSVKSIHLSFHGLVPVGVQCIPESPPPCNGLVPSTWVCGYRSDTIPWYRPATLCSVFLPSMIHFLYQTPVDHFPFYRYVLTSQVSFSWWWKHQPKHSAAGDHTETGNTRTVFVTEDSKTRELSYLAFFVRSVLNNAAMKQEGLKAVNRHTGCSDLQ